jgi:hypothetical protein
LKTTTARVVDFTDGRFVLVFPYDPALVAAVKEIDGRRFDPDSKTWNAPFSSALQVRAVCATHAFEASHMATTAFRADEAPEARTSPVGGTITQKAHRFLIKFPYDPDAVRAIKEINGRRWSPEDKVWLVPISSVRLVREFCDKFGIDMTAINQVPDSDPVIEPDISIDQHGFVIRFPYDRDLTQRIQDLPTASFDRLMGCWRVNRSASIDLALFAEATNSVTNDAVADIFVEAQKQLARIEKSRAVDAELNIPNLNGVLLPFQRAGVVYALESLGYEQQPDGTWQRNK